MSYERMLPSLEFVPLRFSAIERVSRGKRIGQIQALTPTPRQRLQVGNPLVSPRQRLHRFPSREPAKTPTPRQQLFRFPAAKPQQLSGLEFSLKPPKWLRKDVKAVGKFIKKHETALLIGGAALTAGILAPGAVAAAGGALVHGGVAAGGALLRGAGSLARGVGAAGQFVAHEATGLLQRPAASATGPFVGPVLPVATNNPDAYNGVWDSIYQNPHARAESAATDPERLT
jgi:hypothetical protein